MARPLRQDYPGAVHHVFVRGTARSTIAVDERDYDRALYLLERVASEFTIRCHAWCYLPNHTHLLVTSELGNLSRAMHWLGTCTAQRFNARHARAGHLYQGRFGSRIVEDETYLLELARYLPLNPVRARLCEAPEDWPWSSYAATVGVRATPWFLSPGAFLDIFESSDAYVDWVTHGVDAAFLDEDGFPVPDEPSQSLNCLLGPGASDDEIARCHFELGFTQVAIAKHLGISTTHVSRRLARRSQPSALQRTEGM